MTISWYESAWFCLFCLFGFLTSSSTTRLYRGRASRQERLTILRAATHETELGDHDFCLSRSHYTESQPEPFESWSFLKARETLNWDNTLLWALILCLKCWYFPPDQACQYWTEWYRIMRNWCVKGIILPICINWQIYLINKQLVFKAMIVWMITINIKKCHGFKPNLKLVKITVFIQNYSQKLQRFDINFVLYLYLPVVSDFIFTVFPHKPL